MGKVNILLCIVSRQSGEVVLGTGSYPGCPFCAGVFDPGSWSSESNRLTLEINRVLAFPHVRSVC
jgi:hypothetical protein